MITAEKVMKVMTDHRMADRGDRIIIGVSGGADSMCLLFLMSEISESMGFRPEVIHVHHGIRGKSADEDERYVKEICERLKISVKSVHVDVPSFAEKEGLSEEEAGRILRYRIFEEEKPDKIAIAHHSEDSAETLLFNLFRGTGLKGLAGIQPVSGKIIRPLIFFSREEIEEYCREKGIRYRTDETNEDLSYARNRIRRSIIPEAEKINSSALKHILEASERIGEAREFVENAAEELFLRAADLSEMPKRLVLKGEQLKGSPGILKDSVVKKCIVRSAGREKDITSLHVKETEMLLDSSSGKKISLPYGITVRNNFGDLVFSREDKEGGEAYPEVPLLIGDEEEEISGILPDGQIFKVRLLEKTDNIPNLAYTKWLDYDKIKDGALWRTRRSGDRISIQGGSKKVKELFIEEKIPREERDSIYFLADGSEAVWIPGMRIGHKYKVTEETKRVLRVSLEKGSQS
ncbi:MAG: tRNA lysidine(34) synthetase TilS [Lachnospiraceae bacterium]|nr:tRNA lysidine(34) synthetase TilS [Lachnospiraceae bacterium]